MRHATSYHHCTQPDEPEATIPQAGELEMLRYYATEIGVLIGSMEQTQIEFDRGGVKADELLPFPMKSLRRIRAGIERECNGLDSVFATGVSP